MSPPGASSASEASPPGAARHDEDRELVARILRGDAGAREQFADRYVPAVLRFAASRLGSQRELAREVTQAALARALAHLGSYRGEAALLTWLCACCRNEILMRMRRDRSGPVLVELPAEDLLVADESGAEAALLSRERALRVHVTLDALPERYAAVLEWKYVDHLTTDAIARRLGLGTKATESLLGRARRAFRVAYDDLSQGGERDGEELAR
jgi:RNA polymerase sigma-70 factor (ECF subfamily)